MNEGLFFIKPYAVTEGVKDFVRDYLTKHSFRILGEGSIPAEVIAEKNLIDQHYYSLSTKAMVLKPKDLHVVDKKPIQDMYGVAWEDMLDEGKVFNAVDACVKLGVRDDTLESEWVKARIANKVLRLGVGFHLAPIEMEGKDPIYVINGFYMTMKKRFLIPGTCMYYFNLKWAPSRRTFSNVHQTLLGPSASRELVLGSLREKVCEQWEELGIKALGLAPEFSPEYDVFHFPNSSFQAFAEQVVWLDTRFEDNPFVQKALTYPIPVDILKAYCLNPVIHVGDRKYAYVFDEFFLKDMTPVLLRLFELVDFVHRNDALGA